MMTKIILREKPIGKDPERCHRTQDPVKKPERLCRGTSQKHDPHQHDRKRSGHAFDENFEPHPGLVFKSIDHRLVGWIKQNMMQEFAQGLRGDKSNPRRKKKHPYHGQKHRHRKKSLRGCGHHMPVDPRRD